MFGSSIYPITKSTKYLSVRTSSLLIPDTYFLKYLSTFLHFYMGIYDLSVGNHLRHRVLPVPIEVEEEEVRLDRRLRCAISSRLYRGKCFIIQGSTLVGEKFLVMLLRRIISRGFPTNLARGLSTSAATITGREVISASIGLNEDQRNFYELAKSFSENEMKPFAAKWDEDSHFPVDTFKKFGELGFAGIFVNEDFGGSGLSRVDTVVIVEALASGCVGTTAMLTIHNMCAGMIDKYGSEELRQEYLPKLCSLDYMASYCLTEPGSGSDAGSLSTTAKVDGQDYVINGGKAFISGAGLSDIYLVMCRTGSPEEKGGGVSCILIPKDTPGVTFGANENKMGWKCQPTRQITFEDVRVPITNRVGMEGKGFAMAKAGLDGGRLSIGACSLGAAQECFNIALAYTKERKQFGRPIIKNQAIQFKLADMAEKIHISRLALRSAAEMLDNNHPSAPLYCAMAKKIATDKGFEVCNEALQLHGGYGYLKDYEVERYLRDVRVHQILEGTNEVMSMVMGKALSS